MALSAWMMDANPDKASPPAMSSFELCRACAMELFCQIAEMNQAYANDAIAIVHATQDLAYEIQGRQRKVETSKTQLKH